LFPVVVGTVCRTLPVLFSFGAVKNLAEMADRPTLFVFVSINPLPFSLYNGLASNLPFENSTDQNPKTTRTLF
jgi:hypothetical protein